jgi:hypothetical protein
MCDPGRVPEPDADPALALSRLLQRKTGANIEPRVLRLFVAAHWAKASKLAHAIHEQEAESA